MERQLLKVENEPYLYRDRKSKAIISEDKSGLTTYRKLRENLLNKDKEIKQMKNDIDDIKKMLGEILSRL